MQYRDPNENAFSSEKQAVLQVDELDYDARLAAFRKLNPENWSAFIHKDTCHVLLYRAFLDLQSASDLALRHASAQALAHFISSASTGGSLVGLDDLENATRHQAEGLAQNANSMGRPGNGLIMGLIFSSTKKGIAASNLAVRQVADHTNRSILLTSFTYETGRN